MRRFTNIKVIAVFAVTLVIIAAAYWLTSKSLVSLIETVRESSKPDLVLIKVKEINSDITGAESGVRAFALTQDEKYLEPYIELVSNMDKKLDTLRMLTKEKPGEASAIDSIAVLMNKKMDIYEDLLNIRYNTVLQNALEKITTSIIVQDTLVKDTSSVDSTQQKAEVKKGWLKRLFSSNLSKKDVFEKELKAKADSVLKENEKNKQQISDVKQTIAGIKEKESQQLKLQTEKELTLLDRDKDITHDIGNLIRKIEFDEALQLQRKAEEANDAASRSGNLIMMLVIAGAIVLLLLMSLIIYDIAKSNLYRKQLTEAKAHAEKLAKIKEEFLANMSHEIRTPLSAILGYTGRMLKTSLNERQTDYASAIHASSEHLLSIVNDILDLTKLETGNLNLEKINFLPALVAKEVIDVMRFKADEKNILLLYKNDEIKNLSVRGDPMRLKQVLYNLIGNAIKFTEKGSVGLKCSLQHIEAHRTPNSGLLTFTVSDTGIGIPEEKLKTIFTQFSQADSSINRKYGGTGLGLNISKKIIEMQGGTIEVKSELLKGSEFSFVIPYEIGEYQVSSIKYQDKDIPPTFNIQPSAKLLNGIKILLAEDTEINRILQKEMLFDLGAIVTEATSGYEVLSELRTNNSELILMDVQMPGMSGIEAVKEIREKLKSDIPIIAMTANVMQHDLDRYIDAGFDDYITKPFKENELAEKILSVLNGKTAFFLENKKQDNILISDALYDLDELKKTAKGNVDFVIKMLKIFLSSSESLLSKAKTNTEEKNWKELSGNAHRLVPSCKYISANSMALRLKKIEDICNTNSDKIEIKKLLSEVLNEYEKVSAELKEEINALENNLKAVNSK